MLSVGFPLLKSKISLQLLFPGGILITLVLYLFFKGLYDFLKLLVLVFKLFVLLHFLFQVLFQLIIFPFEIVLINDVAVILLEEGRKSFIFIHNYLFLNLYLVDFGIFDCLFYFDVLAFDILVLFLRLSHYLF